MCSHNPDSCVNWRPQELVRREMVKLVAFIVKIHVQQSLVIVNVSVPEIDARVALDMDQPCSVPPYLTPTRTGDTDLTASPFLNFVYITRLLTPIRSPLA